MKRLFFLFTGLICLNISNAQNVGIGTTTPDAALEVKSTVNGFLPPRLTIAQRNAIANPASGLIIYCTDCDELEQFNGAVWKNMSGFAACVTPTLPYIKICSQIWMSKNLDVSKYRNGDSIPQVTNPAAWASLTTGAWCWYNNDSATYASTYGKLYNWYAVNDPRGLAPAGWHIPDEAEWTTLSACLGGTTLAGGKIKKASTAQWQSPNTGADNSSGLTALPAGNRLSNGTFVDAGYYCGFWSTAEEDLLNARVHDLIYNSGNIFGAAYEKTIGYSVRCIRD